MFAVSRMSPGELPAEGKQPRRIINMFEANHESEGLSQEFLSLSEFVLRRCVFSMRRALVVADDCAISKKKFQGIIGGSEHGAAKLVLT